MFRCERLEEQLNDLTELHQNEILNLKQELASMEEKIAYQSYERARDIQVCVGLPSTSTKSFSNVIKIPPFRMSQLFRTPFSYYLTQSSNWLFQIWSPVCKWIQKVAIRKKLVWSTNVISLSGEAVSSFPLMLCSGSLFENDEIGVHRKYDFYGVRRHSLRRAGITSSWLLTLSTGRVDGDFACSAAFC